ncbi:hypothetical protein JCM11251_003322 [Rhodosporidiobolus azoricus]
MSFFIPLPGSPSPSFSGSTLLLPQPSLSSLAQLSCDLLLHNASGWELVGYLGLADFVPAVGGRDSLPGENAPHGIAFGVEVYRLKTPSSDLTLVLPRSPVIRARRPHFLASLNEWVRESGFESVLVVAGVDAALRGDEGLNSETPLRHFLLPTSSSPSSSSSSSTFSSRLSSISPPYAPSTSSSDAPAPTTAKKLPLFPHSGLTRKILETFSSDSSAQRPEVAALTIYTFEGDVAASAFLLADALAHVVQLPSSSDVEDKVEDLSLQPGQEGQVKMREWKSPKSWERGLMGVELGRDVGREMYG